MKTVNFLPMCHHYILLPDNNSVDMSNYDNVTLLPHPYPRSVLVNRTFFDYLNLQKSFDFQAQDIDFIFCHQPEIYHNVINGILSTRHGMSTVGMLFFHWCDCPKSKPIDGWPAGFWRQLEAIDITDTTFFHCPSTLDYIESNFTNKKKKYVISGFDKEYVQKEKVSYFPLGADPFEKIKPFDFPEEAKGKKILVFNHRWANTTGVPRLLEYTEKLGDEYFIWVTDNNAKSPKAGKAAPSRFHVQGLESRAEYAYLLQEAYASICFVDDYATWNLSVQDSLLVGTPCFAYAHPVMDYVLGEDYPYVFETKSQFKKLLELEDYMEWEVPPHDKNFCENLQRRMLESSLYTGKHGEKSNYAYQWLYFVVKGQLEYKKDLVFTTHQKLYLSNAWETFRHYMLKKGIKDDITSKYSKYHVPEELKEEILEWLEPLYKGGNKKVKTYEAQINEKWHAEVLGEEQKPEDTWF